MPASTTAAAAAGSFSRPDPRRRSPFRPRSPIFPSRQALQEAFSTPEGAKKIVSMKAFSKFDNTAEAPAAAAKMVDSKIGKDLKKFLKKHAEGETVALADAKLGGLIKDKLGIACVYSSGVMELMRGVRLQLNEPGIGGLTDADIAPMALGLSHSLSRYKLKFSPIRWTPWSSRPSVFDELDKELNTYAMRVREWYGWHFPEMTKIIQDNMQYAKARDADGRPRHGGGARLLRDSRRGRRAGPQGRRRDLHGHRDLSG